MLKFTKRSGGTAACDKPLAQAQTLEVKGSFLLTFLLTQPEHRKNSSLPADLGQVPNLAPHWLAPVPTVALALLAGSGQLSMSQARGVAEGGRGHSAGLKQARVLGEVGTGGSMEKQQMVPPPRAGRGGGWAVVVEKKNPLWLNG